MEELKSIESGVSVSAHGHRQFAEANCFHPALFVGNLAFSRKSGVWKVFGLYWKVRKRF